MRRRGQEKYNILNYGKGNVEGGERERERNWMIKVTFRGSLLNVASVTISSPGAGL